MPDCCCNVVFESTFHGASVRNAITFMAWLFGNSDLPASSTASASRDPASGANASVDVAGEALQCPVDDSTRARWLAKNSNDNDAAHPFKGDVRPSVSTDGPPRPRTSARSSKSLSLDREISSIPRFQASSSSSSANIAASEGQANSSGTKWVYPSPSQFFSALQRKNRSAREEDMDIVVPIHNAVNERTWREVLQWESEAGPADRGVRGETKVQLVSFKGRPMDRTPRAWFKILLG